jgi:hypothetical protein
MASVVSNHFRAPVAATASHAGVFEEDADGRADRFLFDVPDSPSPRLAWLRRHDLALKRLENGRWRCVFNDETYGCGADEDEACADFCIKTGLRHWSHE